MTENIIVIAAHPDDAVLGVGGTIAKYIQQGKNVTVIRFSYGEKSHQWLKKHVTKKMRKKEAESAKEILGFKKSIYLGLEEGKFKQEAKKIKTKLKKIIKKQKPSKIFTHNLQDPHKDHQAVCNIVLEIVDNIKIQTEVYMFDIWNILNFKRIPYPRLYIDISDTFKTKTQAIKCYSSQWASLIFLLGSIYSKALIYGFSHQVKFAERFFKIR
ncbi:MAG: Diacetylchitobiose deacetylase [Candidatus Woesearchaeota archaeon]|nr:Diacetylchitobiose deacetylase [Candidatus Woesearchaeota archaeon]